jgi:hypothetical protein
MKYMLAFIIDRCCHLQSSSLPSLCNGSSLSATAGSTAGTDILESHVGESMLVPEIWRHLETAPFQLLFHSRKQEEITRAKSGE